MGGREEVYSIDVTYSYRGGLKPAIAAPYLQTSVGTGPGAASFFLRNGSQKQPATDSKPAHFWLENSQG